MDYCLKPPNFSSAFSKAESEVYSKHAENLSRIIAAVLGNPSGTGSVKDERAARFAVNLYLEKCGAATDSDPTPAERHIPASSFPAVRVRKLMESWRIADEVIDNAINSLSAHDDVDEFLAISPGGRAEIAAVWRGESLLSPEPDKSPANP